MKCLNCLKIWHNSDNCINWPIIQFLVLGESSFSNPYVCLSVILSIYLSFYLSIIQKVYLSIYLSIYIYIYVVNSVLLKLRPELYLSRYKHNFLAFFMKFFFAGITFWMKSLKQTKLVSIFSQFLYLSNPTFNMTHLLYTQTTQPYAKYCCQNTIHNTLRCLVAIIYIYLVNQ